MLATKTFKALKISAVNFCFERVKMFCAKLFLRLSVRLCSRCVFFQQERNGSYVSCVAALKNVEEALRRTNKLEVAAANQMLKASRRLREIVSFCSF